MSWRSAAPPTPPCWCRCTEREGEIHAVFTRRRDDLRRHPGEISFPGGRHEPGDADLVRRRCVRPRRRSAWRRRRSSRRRACADADDRDRLCDLPVRRGDRARRAVDAQPRRGGVGAGADARPTCAPATAAGGCVRRGLPIRTDTFVVGDELIWGATARILQDLLERLPIIGRWRNAHVRGKTLQQARTPSSSRPSAGSAASAPVPAAPAGPRRGRRRPRIVVVRVGGQQHVRDQRPRRRRRRRPRPPAVEHAPDRPSRPPRRRRRARSCRASSPAASRAASCAAPAAAAAVPVADPSSTHSTPT